MSDQDTKKNNTALIIVVAILGAVAVFVIGILLGNIMGKSEPAPPPDP